MYILNNSDEVQHYLSSHKILYEGNFPRIYKRWLSKEHNKSFINWFDKIISNNESAYDKIKLMSHKPKLNLITWNAYASNRFSFYTKSKDDHSTMESSGVYGWD